MEEGRAAQQQEESSGVQRSKGNSTLLSEKPDSGWEKWGM